MGYMITEEYSPKIMEKFNKIKSLINELESCLSQEHDEHNYNRSRNRERYNRNRYDDYDEDNRRSFRNSRYDD